MTHEPEQLMMTGTRVSDIPKGIVMPEDVKRLAEIDEIELELRIAAQDKRDEFEALLAGRMPAIMPKVNHGI
jgi:hypothetical protein